MYITRSDVVLSAYGLHLSVYSCPLSLWTAFVSVQLSSQPMDCICQRTVVLSAYGLHLSVYSCPLSLWTAFVSVQLSSQPVDCICQCTVVLSAYGLHLSVYSCPLSLWIAFGLNKNVLVTKEKYKESLCAHQQAIAYSR